MSQEEIIHKEFDCYVKAVDTETGIVETFVNVFSVNGVDVEDADGDISEPYSFDEAAKAFIIGFFVISYIIQLLNEIIHI